MTENNIRKLLAELGVEVLARNGSGWLVARCPYAPLGYHAKSYDHDPSFFVHINNSGPSGYNCFHGGTRFLTRQGTRTFFETAGTTQEVLAPSGEWVRAEIRHFGQQPLHRMVLSRNSHRREILATAGHRWFARSQGGGKLFETTTDALKPGQRLPVVLPAPQQVTPDDAGIRHGIFFGDGTARKARPGAGVLLLFGEKMPLASFFDGYASTNKYIEAEHYAGLAAHMRISGRFSAFKSLPPLHKCSPEYIAGIIAGYIATDGNVSPSAVSLSSASRENLQWVKDACALIGVGTFHIGQTSRKGYGDEESLCYRLNFVRSTLSSAFFVRADQRQAFEAMPPRAYERLGWQVVSVEETERCESVYCAIVPEHHAFVLEDFLLTGNCFTCHQTGSLPQLVTKVLAEQDLPYFNASHRARLLELDVEFSPFGEMADLEEAPEPLDDAVYGSLYPAVTSDAAAMAYLAKRRISDDTIAALDLRVDPEGQRIVFPVRDYQDRLFGFTGRSILEDEERGGLAKIKDYAGLQKRWQILGEDLAGRIDAQRQAEGRPVAPLLVVEGLFALAHLVTLGACDWVCPVATMGSFLSNQQRDILAGMDRPVYFLYDGNQAGQIGLYGKWNARTREFMGGGALDRLKEHVPVYACEYPPHVAPGTGDPDHLTRDDLFWILRHGSRSVLEL